MHRWLRIGLISVATVLPLSLILFLTKRFFSRGDSESQITRRSTTPSQRNSASNSSRNILPHIIHNYNSSVVELHIDQRNIGFIIGRGGDKIKRIQAEADVRIRFRDQMSTPQPANTGASNLDRIAIISGRPECTQLAKNMIEKMLQERIRDEQSMEVRLQIPDWICGRVIGQRGQTIKSMQSMSGAKIVIENPQSSHPPQLLRNCTITGTPDQIRIANELIEAILQRETTANSQRPAYLYAQQRHSYSGYLSGPTGENKHSRLRYSTSSDLRKDSLPLEATNRCCPPDLTKLNLISSEERVYLIYFSQQVQAHLQPLPLCQRFFTAYVSTVDRNGYVWIQLLDDIGMELQTLIEKMTLYYKKVLCESEVEQPITDSNLRTDNLPAFENDIQDVFELKGISGMGNLLHESDSNSDLCDKKEHVMTLDSENSSDSNIDSPFANSVTAKQIYSNNTSPLENSSPISPIIASPFKQGMLVAAPYTDDDKYYRAIIDKVDVTDNKAHVYFLDFGDTDIISITQLHFLKEEFKLLPYQAILCQLDYIEISPQGLTEAAFNRLQELTSCAQWKRICVLPSDSNQPVDRNMGCIRHCPKVTLIDTNEAIDINVNSTLIQEDLVNRADYQHNFS